jgi:shikimate dehydrogenase
MAMLGQLSGATRLFPIIGDPVKYVESPMRLTRTFEERDYNGICVPMQVAADDLDAVMAGLTAARNVDGILVTMPHKFTAFAHCATSAERAKMLRVVSVIRRNPDRTWHGDMLDGLAS